jgi:hypothetical protein
MTGLNAYIEEVVWRGPPIQTWEAFHRDVKKPDQPLLAALDQFPNSVLVAGCQRSGTTALTRLIKRSSGINDLRFGPDDELDGALILSGRVQHLAPGRFCFQTTYLNDRSNEYLEHEDFKLIWILREPESVVYSMLFNWKRAALNRLYDACGSQHANRPSVLFGAETLFRPARIEQACASYIAKCQQAVALSNALGDRMLVVDYDDLVQRKEELLPRIFEFAALDYDPVLLDDLHGKSLGRGRRLNDRAAVYVDERCGDIHVSVRSLLTEHKDHGRGKGHV